MRFTPEESLALTLLQQLFGPKLLQYAVLLFTRGDCFDEEGEFENDVLLPEREQEQQVE